VSTTAVVHLEQRIYPQIFEKIQNGLSRILRGMGETDSLKKTRSPKSRGTVPLRSPGIDSEESILPAYVALRAGTTKRVVDSWASEKVYKFGL
jgi:hypothetical protein